MVQTPVRALGRLTETHTGTGQGRRGEKAQSVLDGGQEAQTGTPMQIIACVTETHSRSC